MKKRFLYAVSILSSVLNTGQAQAPAQNYYIAGDTIRRNDFTYICKDTSMGSIELYNINNTLTNVKQRYKNGQEIPGHIAVGGKPYPWNEIHNNRLIFHNLINMTFTAEDKRIAANDMLLTTIYIDSETGLVKEVEFLFRPEGGFAKVPPESYYRLEQKIRSYICVEITEEGKKWNYNMIVMPYNGKRFGQPRLDPTFFP